jgi:hypothetical protein
MSKERLSSQPDTFSTAFDFRNNGFKESNPFINDVPDKKQSDGKTDSPHEYHEISDDDLPAEKVFDFGPSLMDEMNDMFKSMACSSDQPLSPDVENTNKRNEMAEMNSKLNRKNSTNSATNCTKSKMLNFSIQYIAFY